MTPLIAPEQAEGPLIAAIDIGTSSVRAALFDRLGRSLRGMEARQSQEIKTTSEGAAEGDPDALLEAVFFCLDRLISKGDHLSSRIAGVATCTFVNNLLGIDQKGRAVTPLTTYADTRGESEVAGLKSDFPEGETHDRTGCRFHPSYLPARLRWLARAQPDLFRRVARWVSIGEYMELKLFGETSVTYSVASWSGLLDRLKLEWDSQLLAGLPIRKEQLSPLTDVNRPRRGLLPMFARRWPVLRNLPWFPAIGDGAAANIGSGCVSSYRVALTVGTTSALRVVLEVPIEHLPTGLWGYRVDKRRSLLGGALSEGGSIFAWMKANLNLGAYSPLEEALATMEPDSHGLTVLPFFSGERAPGWAGHARATVHGLSLATTPLQILRASLEAVAYRLAFVFEMMLPLLPENPQVVASGGALLHSPGWLRIVTDVLGKPVAISGVEEASGRGAALLALEALGVIRHLKDAPDFIGSVYEPNPGRHASYRRAMDRQKALYEKLVGKLDYNLGPSSKAG